MTSSTIRQPATRRPVDPRAAVTRTRRPGSPDLEGTPTAALTRLAILVIAIGAACALTVALTAGAAALLISRAAP